MGEHPRDATGPRGSSYEAVFSEKAMPPTRCRHRIVGICAVVLERVEGGSYVAQCLLCDAVGPAKESEETARRALREGT